MKPQANILRFAIARKCAFLAFAAFLHVGIFAADSKADINDGVNRDDPKFVTASLLIVGSGAEMFTCAGHASIRMECPTFKHDFCFSYESEAASSRIFSFFAGKLKMGMFAMPTAKFLDNYRREGRAVNQYKLNLSPQVKQRLWKMLDDKVMEGIDLPYDYLQRGCAWSTLQILMKALRPTKVEHGSWPEKFNGYQREVYMQALTEFPWTQFFITSVVGTDPDRDMPNVNKVIAPIDLLAYLQRAKFDGVTLIAPDAEQVLLKQTVVRRRTIVTPMVVAVALVALALSGVWFRWRWLALAMLAVQVTAGCLFTYLIFFSALPATSWNWLFVPFNPVMPVLAAFALGRARREGTSPSKGLVFALAACAIVLAGWIAGMLFSTHQLTNPAHVVLACAYVVLYAGVAWRTVKGGRANPDARRDIEKEE